MNTSETATELHALLAPTPPMGWNSYTCFGITVREHEVLANARCMAAELAPFGWEYVVLDGMWYHDTGPLTGEEPWGAEPHPLDDYGRLLPNLRKFPSAAGGAGLKPLADAIHALGLKFGLHLMRGIPRRAVELNLPILGTSYRAGDIADTANPCTWFEGLYGVNMSHPGGQAYYDSVLKLFAEWQIDYLKVDDCGLPSYQSAEVEGIFRAVECSGRRIIMSLAASDEKSTFHAEHLKRHTHLGGWESIFTMSGRNFISSLICCPSGCPIPDRIIGSTPTCFHLASCTFARWLATNPIRMRRTSREMSKSRS